MTTMPSTFSGKRRRALVRVRYALSHHAQEIAPLKSTLQDCLDWSGIFHRIDSAKGGGNSNKLVLYDGREYFLRGRLWPAQRPFISIRKRGTSKEIRCYTERDIIRFVESL
jgi:hypothetical protein